MFDGRPHGGTLLLGPDRSRPVPDPGCELRRPSIDPPPGRVGPVPATTTTDCFRSPALVLVAAAAIYLGYCELGVIATTGAVGVRLVTARPAVAVEGALILGAAWALTRPAGGHRLRGRTPVVAGGIVVAAVSGLAVATGLQVAHEVLGVADFLVAAVSLGAVLALERGRRTAVESAQLDRGLAG